MTTLKVCSREQACTSLNRFWGVQVSRSSTSTTYALENIPQTPLNRLYSHTSKTILYLAYGSNLSAETFKGNRGIKPLSAINVHVPSLSLTFDLAGIPYIEPCFANTRYRDPSSSSEYHKDRWHKGLIGVVYEVTPEDYRTIIATEGGGASYQDVVVDCYSLPHGSKTVDPSPKGVPFKAHTLLNPSGNGISRPDPSYAQASVRYLKLITDGAEEHALPAEYIAYLDNLQPYTMTTYKQRIGSAIFLGFWLPIVLAVMGFSKLLADGEGKIPAWFASVVEVLFRGVWGSYDSVFKGAFGDGERTIGKDDESSSRGGCERRRLSWCEKGIRLEGS